MWNKAGFLDIFFDFYGEEIGISDISLIFIEKKPEFWICGRSRVFGCIFIF